MTRRRIILLLVGLMHLGMGLTLAAGPMPPRNPDLAVLYELIPPTARIALWFGIGLTVIALALIDRRRNEEAAWTVAVLMPMERVASYAWSGIQWLIPGYPPGAAASFGSMIAWLAILGILVTVSRWADHTEVAGG